LSVGLWITVSADDTSDCSRHGGIVDACATDSDAARDTTVSTRKAP
jgi:hypothetical protein